MSFVTTVIYISQETIVPREQHTPTELNLCQFMSNPREISRAMLLSIEQQFFFRTTSERSGGRQLGTNAQIVTMQITAGHE